jgi:hypothetical protein
MFEIRKICLVAIMLTDNAQNFCSVIHSSCVNMYSILQSILKLSKSSLAFFTYIVYKCYVVTTVILHNNVFCLE